ncbi:hypothetical protein D3C86_1025680 [compost metagenome]
MILYQPFAAHATGQIAHGGTDELARRVGRRGGDEARRLVRFLPFGEGAGGQRRHGQVATGRQQRGQPAQAGVQVGEPLHGQAGADQVVLAIQRLGVLAVQQLEARRAG